MARYTLEKRIGEGGIAEVFRARADSDAGVTRVVAVKRLLPEFAQDPRVQARFIDEARISSRLRHPNIVAVTEFFEEDGRQHLVMELVEGVSVDQLVDRGAGGRFVPLSVTARIVHDAARALEYAHAEGVLHRDVSGCNLLVSRSGEVKLGDFGLADARDRVSSTAPGELVGKAAYMSPERRVGAKATTVDDLFALGVVLDSLLSAADPRERGGADGAELASVAARLTAAAPADRVPSAPALLALLRPLARASAETVGALVVAAPLPRAKPVPKPKLRTDDLLVSTDRGARKPVVSKDDSNIAPTGARRAHLPLLALTAALIAALAAAVLFWR